MWVRLVLNFHVFVSCFTKKLIDAFSMVGIASGNVTPYIVHL